MKKTMAKIKQRTFKILDAAAKRKLPTRLSCKSKPEEKVIGGKWLAYLPAILDLVDDGFLRCEVEAEDSKGKPYHIHNIRITELGHNKLHELREKMPLAHFRRGTGKVIFQILSHLGAIIAGYAAARFMGNTP